MSFSSSSEGWCGEANETRLSQTDLVDVDGGGGGVGGLRLLA